MDIFFQVLEYRACVIHYLLTRPTALTGSWICKIRNARKAATGSLGRTVVPPGGVMSKLQQPLQKGSLGRKALWLLVFDCSHFLNDSRALWWSCQKQHQGDNTSL